VTEARRGSDRWLYAIAGALVLAGVFHLLVFALDDRAWSGPVSWRKPFTFGLSFGLTLATITWLSSALRVRPHVRRALLVIFAIDCVVEVMGVSLQAWRDQPSHLNTTTPTNAAIAYTLAVGGAVLILTLGTFAVIAIRGRVTGPPSLVLAYRAGFALLLSGLASGVAMIAVGSVAMRTGTAEHAYQVTGFLKQFHGATLHAVLVLPATAWLVQRLTDDERLRVRAVGAVAGAYVAVAALLLVLGITNL
jgi:hypothetical protein